MRLPLGHGCCTLAWVGRRCKHQGVRGAFFLGGGSSLDQISTLTFGVPKAQGVFCLGEASAPPTPCCTPGCRRPPFVLGAPPPAEPSPSLPSVCPCGRLVSLKGLQAWLRGCHPVPAGPGTGQPRTAPDSPGQPRCGRAGTTGTTGTAGTRADPVVLGGSQKERENKGWGPP